MRYEYIRIEFGWGDLSEMNRLSSVGWKVISVIQDPVNRNINWALMERTHENNLAPENSPERKNS